MLPMAITNATRKLFGSPGKDGTEVKPLHVLDEEIDGQNYITSVWQPTPAELEDLKAGGSVRLVIMGSNQPPVYLTTQPPPGIWPERETGKSDA